jgi:hypothetical protein
MQGENSFDDDNDVRVYTFVPESKRLCTQGLYIDKGTRTSGDLSRISEDFIYGYKATYLGVFFCLFLKCFVSPTKTFWKEIAKHILAPEKHCMI